ncbi:hypothetical protein GCM10009527_086910 [Actinomadura nitritigenes]
MQVEQRQDLEDLRRLAAPRRQDLRGEPFALAAGVVDAPVVHPGRRDLDRPGRGDHRAGPVVPVADHQTATSGIGLGGQLSYVLVDFRLQRGGQHPPRPLSHDLVDQGAGLGGTFGGDYAQHRRALPTRAATQVYSVTS